MLVLKTNQVKVVFFVPISVAEDVRSAVGEAGAGEIGNYTHCSFSSVGTGRFIPKEKANPAIGASGKLETVSEERVEIRVSHDKLPAVKEAIRQSHPYEEVAIDVYPLLE